MTFDDVLWQYLFLVANAFLIGAAALAILRVKRELKRSREFWESPTAMAFAGDGYDDRSLKRMIDQRFLALRTELDGLKAKSAQEPHEIPTPPPLPAASMSFDYAARMAKAGASPEELVRGCGLNRGEAELLVRLHAARAAPVARH